MTDLINSYGDNTISTLVKEVRNIKDRTTAILTRDDPNLKHIALQRALSPLTKNQHRGALRNCDEPELFPALVMAAKKAGVGSFKIDVDIVSGWSTSSNNRYGSLHITRNWDVDDIVAVSDHLAAPNGGDGALETNEWLCLNRNENGLMEFNVNDCAIDSIPEELEKKWLQNNREARMLVAELQGKASHQSSRRILPLRPMSGLNAPQVKLAFLKKLKILFNR